MQLVSIDEVDKPHHIELSVKWCNLLRIGQHKATLPIMKYLGFLSTIIFTYKEDIIESPRLILWQSFLVSLYDQTSHTQKRLKGGKDDMMPWAQEKRQSKQRAWTFPSLNVRECIWKPNYTLSIDSLWVSVVYWLCAYLNGYVC